MEEKRQPGGQPGNTNSWRHGARSTRPSLALGSWGSKFGGIRQQALRYRKRLLSEIEKIHGKTTLVQEELATSAASLEMCRRIAQRELSDNEMSADDRLAVLQKIANFTLQRLQIVGRLKLDKGDGSAADDDPAAIYADPPPADNH